MIFFKFLLMCILPFYRIDFPINNISTEFTEVYYEKSIPVERDPCKNIQKRYSEIYSFFSKERSGWKYDIDTYAPYHIINFQKMTINVFTKDFIVVNYLENGKYIQISKRTETPFPDGCN